MLELVKDALGISTTDLDNVIQTNIEACKLELYSVGVSSDKVDSPDELLTNVIILYVKYMMNWRGDGERFRQYYEAQLQRLPLVSHYRDICNG